MVAEAGTFVINPALYPRDKMPFDPEKDFIADHRPVRIHHALIATPSFAGRTAWPS